jgi:glycosyltransferase involved in cell wall biosynthesis
MSPKKGVVRAIDIARRCGVPLKIAAKIYPEEQRYFDQAIAPLLDTSRPLVDYVGEVGGREKEQLLAGARALLFPIDWPEPFGLVMIESMACGTPVIGWRRGSVPEVLEDGVTGFIVDTVEEAVRAVGRIDEIDRGRCRRVFEERFDAGRMARDYLDVYARVARAVR